MNMLRSIVVAALTLVGTQDKVPDAHEPQPNPKTLDT